MRKNVSPKYLKRTLTLAAEVRERYNFMGVASTQQVRNPEPAQILVDKAMPRLISPDAMLDTTVKTIVTHKGRKIVKTFKTQMPARDVLGAEYWENNGVTVQDIQADLERQGFAVKEPSIRAALHWGQTRTDYANVTMPRNDGQIGRPRAIYFKTSSH